MNYKVLTMPMKLSMCLDKYSLKVFMGLMFYRHLCESNGKIDNEGFFSFKFNDFIEFNNLSDKPTNAVLNMLEDNGIITIQRTGKGKGINGKGSNLNKYRINDECFARFDAIKNKDIPSNILKVPIYNKKSQPQNNSGKDTIPTIKNEDGMKNPNHKDMVRIESQPKNPNQESDKNPNHYGKDSEQVSYSNIIVEGNNSNDIIKKEKKIKKKLDKEKNKKEVEDLVQFRGNATIAKNAFGNDFSSSNNKFKIEDNFIAGEDEDFKGVADHLPMDIDMRCFEDDGLPHNTGRGLTAIQSLEKRINDDPNAPKLPLKYFNPMEIPDTITENDEFTKWITATMYRMSRANVWCDFVNIRNNYYSIRKAVDRGYEIGTTVKTWNEKKMTEKWQGVLANKFRYFIKKYSNLPMQHGYEDMYSTLGIEPLSDEEYIKRQKEWLEKNNPKEFNEVKDNKDWQPWMMEGNGYVDEIEDDNEDYDFIREDIGKDIDPSVVNGMNDEEMANFVCDAK